MLNQYRIRRRFLWLPRRVEGCLRWLTFVTVLEELRVFKRSVIYQQYYPIAAEGRAGWYDPRGLAGQVRHVYGKKHRTLRWVERK